MLDVEKNHDREHEHRFEHVKIHLVAEKNPILASGVLGDTEHTPNHDQKTGQVEDQKVSCPR
jgi:hypothetical protein